MAGCGGPTQDVARLDRVAMDVPGERQAGEPWVDDFGERSDIAEGMEGCPAHGPCPVEYCGIGELARFGGNILDVDVLANTAFVAGGPAGLLMLDVSLPGEPILLQRIDDSFLNGASRVRRSGDRLYVLSQAYLTILDVERERAPLVVGTLETGATDIEVQGETVILEGYNWGAVAVDVTDPRSPGHPHKCEKEGARAAAALRDLMFIASADGTVAIFDYSIYNFCEEVGSVEIGGMATDMTVVGGHVYAAVPDVGVVLLDVSERGEVVVAGTLAAPGVSLLRLAGQTLVGTQQYEQGVYLIDVQDPAAPTLAAAMDFEDVSLSGASLAGGILYLAAMGHPLTPSDTVALGLVVVDISDTTAPSVLGRYDLPVRAGSVVAVGTTAFVGDFEGGIHAVNLSDTSAPVSLGTNKDFGLVLGLAAFGSHYLVVIDGDPHESGGFVVVDVSDPSSMVTLARLSTVGIPNGLAVGEHVAVVTTWEPGLCTIDLSLPSSPGILWNVKLEHPARQVSVDGSLAYVTTFDKDTGDGALEVWDLSDPTVPTPIGHQEFAGQPRGLDVAAGTAYVMSQSYSGGAFLVVDVSMPTSPTLLASLPNEKYLALSVSGSLAYATTGSTEFAVWNVADRSNPLLVDTPDLGFRQRSFWIGEGIVLVAAEDNGIVVLKPSACSD
jgi:hypothetical protein